MYLNFYNFKKEPFQITPDPEFLFLSPSHKEAMASIIYGIEGKKGFVAIVGGVGVGKTTILRSYLERVDRDEVKIIYIFNANLSFRSLLQTVFQELGIEARTDDIFLMVNQLHEVLIDLYKKGRTVVLIVDEAQNMPVETLENLRMLSNLETATEKLIQIVLLGQPEFNDRLNLHELRQLKQRIAIRTTISPLTREESERYIQHRLSKVMLKDEPVLTRGALKQIVGYCRGIPRVINIVCDNAFITGYGYQKNPVTARIIKEICADFESNRGREQEEERGYYFRWKTAAAMALLLAVIGGFWISPYRDDTWERLRAQVLRIKEPAASNHVRVTVAAPAQAEAAGRQSALPSAVPAAEAEGRPGPGTVAPAPVSAPAAPSAAAPSPASAVTSAAPRAGAPAAEGPKAPGPSVELKKKVGVVVERGDTLSRLIMHKYGAFDADLLGKVKKENPAIKNVDRIYIGDVIMFPEDGSQAGGGRR